MRVSDKYKLGLRQAQLDFVDVDIDADLPVFIDPRALCCSTPSGARSASPWSRAVFTPDLSVPSGP